MGDPIVTTRAGAVRGCEDDGTWVFRGIAYAAPPIGPRRLRPPAPPAPHGGVRDAKEFGPIAPQPQSGIGAYVPGDPVAQDEDCLLANVWTPELRGRLPVLVYVHGGAYLNGSGSGVLYRGAALARRGAVVVTFNYRLGALGFLAHPALADATSGGFGNWGLLDQVALLQWVQDNIGAFGGDPGRVTVFGESAGAMSIADLLAAPAARGLFRRAILESGAPSAAQPEATAEIAERFARLLGLGGLRREALAAVPIADLLAAQATVCAEIDEGFGLPLRPVVDGGLLTAHPADAIASGATDGVDLLVGTNRDEFKFFSFSASGLRDLESDDDVAALVGRYLRQAGLGPDRVAPAAVVAHYRAARAARDQPVAPRDLFDAIAGDWIFRVPQLRLVDAHTAREGRAFSYLFSWESPFAGGALGACHALELPFVFGTLDQPLVGLFAGADDDAFALSAQMQAAWVAFATTGDPTSEATGTWARYEVPSRTTMVFGRSTRPEDGPYEAERSFWERPLGRYGVGGPIEGARPLGVALMAPEVRGETGT